MEIQLKGKIFKALPAREGVSQQGKDWKVREYVLEDEKQEKVSFEVFGAQRIEDWDLQEGDTVILTADLASREWGGKWYTRVSAYKCERVAREAVTYAEYRAQEKNTSELPF